MIRRWDPYDELTSLRESMERLFEGVGTRRPVRLVAPALWEPAVEVFETHADVTVRAEMPGIDPKEAEVIVSGDTLTLKAEAKAEEEEEGRTYSCRELRYGAFQRTVTLPAAVRADEAKAVFKNGILEVQIPKAAEARSRTIKVEGVA